MKQWVIFLWLAAVLALPALAGNVVVVPIQGEVSEAQFIFLRRALKEAEREKASALVLDMDTYGGKLNAAVKMLDALSHASIPTYTFIDSNAGSAGALIALSTQHIYMAPVSAIGAAAPVSGGGQEIQETMKEKVVSYFSGYFRSAAERNGYRPELAEGFINEDKEVKIGDKVLSEKGSLLTLSAQEATELYEGKPLLAEKIVSSVEELVKSAGLEGAIRRVEPTGFEQAAFWITTLAPLFLLGGIVGTYLEIKTPGFGVPGFIAFFCFLIYFTGHYIAGLSGLEVVALFLGGLVFVLVDLILFPGTFILGVVGAGLMLGALIWAMVDRYPTEAILPTPEMLVWPLLNLALAVALAAIAIALLFRYLPRTTLYHRLVLGAAQAAGPSLPAELATVPNLLLEDELGTTLTALRPSGKAEFGERHLDVVTMGEFLPAHTPVRIIQIEGARIVVQQR